MRGPYIPPTGWGLHFTRSALFLARLHTTDTGAGGGVPWWGREDRRRRRVLRHDLKKSGVARSLHSPRRADQQTRGRRRSRRGARTAGGRRWAQRAAPLGARLVVVMTPQITLTQGRTLPRPPSMAWLIQWTPPPRMFLLLLLLPLVPLLRLLPRPPSSRSAPRRRRLLTPSPAPILPRGVSTRVRAS